MSALAPDEATAALVDLRARFAARGIALGRDLRSAFEAIERAPGAARPRILAAIAARHPALAPLCGDGPNGPICPAYPLASREIQARLALGESPARIMRGLTSREAHAALAHGCSDPIAWLVPDDFADAAAVHSVPVARWLVACLADPKRRAAIGQERTERGPHGEEIRGRLLDRIDKIRSADLVRGSATGVREAYERAAKRAYAAWERGASTQHAPLAPLPRWWVPVRCARPLMSAADLAREGRDLAHCVGTYAPYVRDQQSVIVSVCVRDRTGDVHRSTAEIDRSTIRVSQHKAHANRAPHPLCVRALDVCLQRWNGRTTA